MFEIVDRRGVDAKLLEAQDQYVCWARVIFKNLISLGIQRTEVEDFGRMVRKLR